MFNRKLGIERGDKINVGLLQLTITSSLCVYIHTVNVFAWKEATHQSILGRYLNFEILLNIFLHLFQVTPFTGLKDITR